VWSSDALAAKNESIWRVTEVVSGGQGTMVIHADYAVLPTGCPRCGSQRRPRRFGAIDTSYRDAPFLGRQVIITVNAQRFQCADCKHAFFQELADMDGKRRMTARCAAYVIDQVMARSSMKDVAKIVGIDEKGVRNVFEDRGVIFSVGDPSSSDWLVCECCVGVYPRADMRLAPAKHFGKWRNGDLKPEVNVCLSCFEYPRDAWRAGVVRRT
jgi:transposase-like protein